MTRRRADLAKLRRDVEALADEVAALADDEDLELTDVQRQFRRAFASPGFPFAELVRLAHEKTERERPRPTPPATVEDLAPECPTAIASGRQAAPPPATPPEVAPAVAAQPQEPPSEPAQSDAALPRTDSSRARLRRAEFTWGDIFRR